MLAWLTAGAVILSLFVVWDNRTTVPASNWVMGVAAALDAIAMVAGLAFVVTIIDPSKYQKAAERELELEQQTRAEVVAVTSAEEFFHAFRQLEQSMRKQINRLGLMASEREQGSNGKGAGSVRQMASALLENESISTDFHTELLQVNKYRNLLYHGHVREADAGMVERTMRATGRIKQLAAQAASSARSEPG